MNYVTEIEKLVPIPLALKGTETNSVYDYEPMRQIIEDAGMDVIRNIEQFKPQDLNLFVTPIFVDASGTALETGIVEYVERNNKSCIEIQPVLKNMAKDNTSLNYATEEYPVFYKEHGKIYILPEPQETNNSFESSECLFSKGEITVGTTIYNVTDVTFINSGLNFTSNTTEEELLNNLVSHNLQTGDYLEIKQNLTNGVSLFSIPKSYVIRINANTVRFPSFIWDESVFGNVLVGENSELNINSNWIHSGTVYKNTNLLGYVLYVNNYQPRLSEAIAYIVKPPTTRGQLIASGGDYYNPDSNEILTASTGSIFTNSNVGTAS